MYVIMAKSLDHIMLSEPMKLFENIWNAYEHVLKMLW